MIKRLFNFEDGTFLINDQDVRSLDSKDIHAHTSAVFQNFSRFNASLRENVGIGCIDEIDSDLALKEALQAGGGNLLLDSLPDGLESTLEYAGYDYGSNGDYSMGMGFGGMSERRSLSGGEVSSQLSAEGCLLKTCFTSGNV